MGAVRQLPLLPYLEGILELSYFKGAKVFLLSGLRNGSTIHEFKCF